MASQAAQATQAAASTTSVAAGKPSTRTRMRTGGAGRAVRPYSKKSRQLEPRGRPGKGQPVFSGATEADPLVSVQILKVRQSVWTELAKAAGERKWHRSVLVRELLDEWFKKRKGTGKTGKTRSSKAVVASEKAA